MWEQIKSLFKRETGEIIAIGICLLCTIWIYSCESRVMSLSGDRVKLTRSEIQAELDAYLALAEIRFEQLDQQDAFKETVFNIGINIAEGGTISPIGAALILGNILGIGATVDNVRKRKVISTNLTNYVAAAKKSAGSDTS
ncbi:unnamed protein product [marine sediment metagenome]|uniref:Uncharacterized protein n=1 Tax=marine sediment metagenome TaxID=412755 RepID=X1ICV2_9ZZZZ